MKYIPGIVAIGIIGIVLIVGLPSQGPETSSSHTDHTIGVGDVGTIISVTDATFVPTEISIPVGTPVTFRNLGSQPHWPASDAHPSHTIYPEFDPKKSLAPGENWSFTFDKPGTWRFHDHENPNLRGLVTVAATETEEVASVSAVKPAQATKHQHCPITSNDFNCFEEHYQYLVKEEGIPAAFADLKKAYEASSFVRSQCHPLTHVIGRSATVKYAKVSEAYAHGDGFCWSGYYHGVLEGVIGKIGSAQIISQLDTLCSDVPGKESYSFDYYNCVHGLGHGLMALTKNELFESLKLCDNVQGSWEQTSCYGGVFMENVIVDNKNHFTKYLRPAEPLYPCNTVEERYKESCYLMQTSYMLKVTGNNFAKVFELCRTADENYRSSCFISLGRDASGQSLSNVEQTKVVCDLGASEREKSYCVVGAVKDFVSYHHSDVQAKQLCAAFSGDIRLSCDNTVESYYKSF